MFTSYSMYCTAGTGPSDDVQGRDGRPDTTCAESGQGSPDYEFVDPPFASAGAREEFRASTLFKQWSDPTHPKRGETLNRYAKSVGLELSATANAGVLKPMRSKFAYGAGKALCAVVNTAAARQQAPLFQLIEADVSEARRLYNVDPDTARREILIHALRSEFQGLDEASKAKLIKRVTPGNVQACSQHLRLDRHGSDYAGRVMLDAALSVVREMQDPRSLPHRDTRPACESLQPEESPYAEIDDIAPEGHYFELEPAGTDTSANEEAAPDIGGVYSHLGDRTIDAPPGHLYDTTPRDLYSHFGGTPPPVLCHLYGAVAQESSLSEARKSPPRPTPKPAQPVSTTPGLKAQFSLVNAELSRRLRPVF
jgi:hypothetical protein